MATILVLTAITGAQITKKLTASGRLTKIGSASSNDIVLHERQIEQRHAEIHQMLDRWFVVPLTARGQGLSLNGLPVEGRSRLSQNDVLTLGGISYRVSFSEMLEQEVGRPSGAANALPRLGDYFIRRGMMTNEQIARTAKRQSELQNNGNRIAFGQVAYELGYINRSQLDAALADQRNDFNQQFRD